ncbi:MAG: YbaK/EbsC family protein [Anaerolineae bacterium]
MEKTLAMKLLEGRKVKFEVFEYPETERDAEKIAVCLDVPAAEVYKTLVVTRPKGKPILFMLAAERRLNLKKLAKGLGEKKLALATHADAEKMTGLKVGGISPLALLNKGFAIYIDEAGRTCDRVLISSGKKGLNLGVPVKDLIKITGAKYVGAADLA